MRKLIAVLLVGFFGCQDTLDLPDSYWGEATAEIDGQVRKYAPYAVINSFIPDRINFNFDRFDNDRIHRQALYIYKVPIEVGVYPLVNTGSRDIDEQTGGVYDLLVGDGHVLGDTYYINLGDDTGEYIEITRIEGDQIWGKFQLSMYRRNKDLGPSPYGEPDYITFTNGEFHTRLWEP